MPYKGIFATLEKISFPVTKEELREMCISTAHKTEFDNYNFSSTVRNRSAALTLVNGTDKTKLNDAQQRILRELPETIEKVKTYITHIPVGKIEQIMGKNDKYAPLCTLYMSLYNRFFARIPYVWMHTLYKTIESSAKSAHFKILNIPEWPETERQILVFPEDGMSIILGSDYFGEVKKGFLRLAMYNAKKNDMLGLHAGIKTANVRVGNNVKKYVLVFFGNSGTGKTTHSCHNHYLHENGESIGVVQDDVIFLDKNGSTLGTETGFYIKTEGLNLQTQPLLYKAALKSHAIFENVLVKRNSAVDFENDILTGNGRSVIRRDDLELISDSINTESLDKIDSMFIFFITRRHTILPIASKLTPEQGAAAFMLGESIETSAGDPRKAGESIRIVGTNPFIIGDPVQEGNWFYDFLKANEEKVQCYILNTGGVGEIIEKTEFSRKVIQPVLRATIPDMSNTIRAILKDIVVWVEDTDFGCKVPVSIPNVDLEKFRLDRFYSIEQVHEFIQALKKERLDYISKFRGLNPAIVGAV
ncbi:MAG: phosphoenolpyruvate carboxykinase [Candidatus Aenigmarchaeota archaeon]|nr:phosphoenolpyruvate carboxykinase [Candidatus Aenigmarchaeota archaeon]